MTKHSGKSFATLHHFKVWSSKFRTKFVYFGTFAALLMARLSNLALTAKQSTESEHYRYFRGGTFPRGYLSVVLDSWAMASYFKYDTWWSTDWASHKLSANKVRQIRSVHRWVTNLFLLRNWLGWLAEMTLWWDFKSKSTLNWQLRSYSMLFNNDRDRPVHS